MVGLFFHDYFPYLPDDQRHFIASFIIGACMPIFFERYRILLRAFISGVLFMLLTKPQEAYVLLWGPPLFLPLITILTQKGSKGFVYRKGYFMKYLGLSFFSVIILICTLIIYANAQVLLEGNNILKRAY
jgi:hypothetical protein